MGYLYLFMGRLVQVRSGQFVRCERGLARRPSTVSRRTDEPHPRNRDGTAQEMGRNALNTLISSIFLSRNFCFIASYFHTSVPTPIPDEHLFLLIS